MIGIYETLKLTQVQGHKVICQGHNLQESTFGSMKMYICVKETRLINLRGVNVLDYYVQTVVGTERPASKWFVVVEAG